MTVCVSIKVHDCIVFAADSAATLTDHTGQIINVFNNADKVFNLHRHLPVVAMTCGMGHIDGRSISNLAKEFRRDLMTGSRKLNADSYTIEEIVKHAFQFLDQKYGKRDGHGGDSLDFFIGGYGSAADHGEVWRVSIREGVLIEPELLQSGDTAGGVNWGGQGSAIARLLLGVDPMLSPILQEAGMDAMASDEIVNLAISRLGSPVCPGPMPTIDAVGLAEFLVDVTKGYFSFMPGANIVGGSTDVATVTKWEGFKWIKRKHFYPEDLNRSQNDHVC